MKKFKRLKFYFTFSQSISWPYCAYTLLYSEGGFQYSPGKGA